MLTGVVKVIFALSCFANCVKAIHRAAEIPATRQMCILIRLANPVLKRDAFLPA